MEKKTFSCRTLDTTDVSLATDNMTVRWDKNGSVCSVLLYGEECMSASSSGFFITDAADGKEYGFHQPLVGKAEKKQSGTIEGANLQMDVTYCRKGHAIFVNGLVSDTSGNDRLITLEYRLPFFAQGMYWYDDISTRRKVEAGGVYNRPTDYYPEGHKMSLYPYGTVSNGEQAIAFGVPLELPQTFLIGYQNTDDLQAMTVRFDFVLSDKTKKMPAKAEFRFVIYAPAVPDWGFRSASQDYYDLFPDSFAGKSHGGGNWLFQHDYEQVENVEDYCFGYNETPHSFRFDAEHGVTSLRYTAPAEQWMLWPGMPKTPEPTYDQYLEHFHQLLRDDSGAMDRAFPAVSVKNVAEALKNSAVLLENGQYFTVGWYAYDVSVCFVTNHNPDIPGWNSYQLQLSQIERAEKAAEAENARLGGVYIDNLAGLGTYNFREDHFQYADMPLLWDIHSKRLTIPSYSSMYSYTRAIRERCDRNGQIIMANMVFPERGITPYIHMVDVPGSECGPDWGWDPYIQRLRRTMAYRKPWMLLLGHATGNSGNWGASYATYEQREAVMKSSVAYGLFANVIGYRVEMVEYENARPLFQKYTYIAVMQDKLGWNPITYAVPRGTTHVDCERFGDPGKGLAIFTAYHTGETEADFVGSLEMDLTALKVANDRAEQLIVFDPIHREVIPSALHDGKLSYDLSLGREDLSVVMVGTKEEIATEMQIQKRA